MSPVSCICMHHSAAKNRRWPLTAVLRCGKYPGSLVELGDEGTRVHEGTSCSDSERGTRGGQSTSESATLWTPHPEPRGPCGAPRT